MYNPKITYHFSMDDVKRLNEEIKGIAENFHEEETGWFQENKGRQFTDENGNTFDFDILGRFFRADEPNFDLHYIRLKKDGIIFEFDYRIFQDHI
jgi:hypothetical protein